MKTITPVNIWVNGQMKEAKILDSYATNVTLNISAQFYWALFEENADGTKGAQLANGNIGMDGADYQAWDQDSFAWDYIAGKLNLTITGDYVEPVVVQNDDQPE